MLSNAAIQAIGALPAILSIQETADFFQVQYLTIFRLIHRGIIPAYKDDEGKWCITRLDLRRYCSKNCNL
jgi:excisionase family DNA binding protein